MRHEAECPEAQHHGGELPRALRPADFQQPGESDVEYDFTGEGPAYGVPEGSEVREEALHQQRCEEGAGPELAVAAGSPFQQEHGDADQHGEQIDGVQAGEARHPEVCLAYAALAVRVVVAEDEARDEEEETDEDEADIDERVEGDGRMARPGEAVGREMEHQDGEGEEGAQAGEGR